jgi:endoglucanase
MTYLCVRNGDFMLDNRPVRLRGVGLGNWLNLEHFMLGIPGTDSEIRDALTKRYGSERADRFWDCFYAAYVGEADIAFYRELGMNSVRVPFNYRRVVDNQGRFDAESAGIRQIDRLLDSCRRHRILAILDLHAAPGGQNPDWHSDNASGTYPFWERAPLRTQVATLWRDIAAYYKDDPMVGGYDLLNEPCYFEKSIDSILVEFYAACINEIRKVDTRRLIFIEGNTYARDFTMFRENMDDNLAYTFHYYPFLQLPGALDSGDVTLKIEASLERDVTLSHLTETLGRPIWCGETGHPLCETATVSSLPQFLDILEQRNISWALWPHKDARAWGLTFPTIDAPWMRFVEKTAQGWSFFDVFNQDSIISVNQSGDRMGFYRGLAESVTLAYRKFEERLQSVSFDTLMAAASSLTFARCEHYDALVKKIKTLAEESEAAQ